MKSWTLSNEFVILALEPARWRQYICQLHTQRSYDMLKAGLKFRFSIGKPISVTLSTESSNYVLKIGTSTGKPLGQATKGTLHLQELPPVLLC